MNFYVTASAKMHITLLGLYHYNINILLIVTYGLTTVHLELE